MLNNARACSSTSAKSSSCIFVVLQVPRRLLPLVERFDFLVSVAVFGLSLSVVQFCGLVLTFGAALGYSLVGARAKEKAG